MGGIIDATTSTASVLDLGSNVLDASRAAALATALAAGYANQTQSALGAASALPPGSFLGSPPTALPFEVTALAGGVGTGTGGTPGEYAMVITGGPAGHKAYVTIDSTGKIASYRNNNPGLSASNAAPTYALTNVPGLTGATAPTATVGVIPPGRIFYALSSDGYRFQAWGNNAGVLASAPFGGTQITVPANIFDSGSLRYAYGKQVAFGLMDGSQAGSLFTTVDGYTYGKFAIGVGAAANGLTWTQDSGGFWRAQLGTVQGQLPLGAAGDLIDTGKTRYFNGQQIIFALTDTAGLTGGLMVTTDGTLHGKFAIRLGTASNGLTWVRGGDGYWNLQLGAVQGQMPLGSAGDVIDTSGTRYYNGQQVIFAQTDANGLAALIVTADGKVYAPKIQSTAPATGVTLGKVVDSASYLYTTVLVSSLTQIIQTRKSTGVATQITATGNNNHPAISFDASKLLYSSDRTGADRQFWQPIPATGVEYPVISYSDNVLIGDSRTVAYGPAFAALYPARATDNEGFSGQDSSAIAGRFGAIPTTMTVAGASIPASGSVAVSSLAPNLFQHPNYTNQAIHGSLAGVPGTLAFNSSTGGSFIRDTAGTAVAVTNPAGFVPDSGTAQNTASTSGMLALSLLQSRTAIIGPGYNDLAYQYIYATQTYSQATTLVNIAAIVAALKPLSPRFVILGVYVGEGILVAGSGGLSSGQSSLGLAPTQAAAAGMYNGAAALNAALAAAYPNNFVDLQAALVTAGYGESATINGMASTIINASALTDGVHPYTSVGQAPITAAIQSLLTAKGW